MVLGFDASGAAKAYNAYLIGSKEAVAVGLITIALHAPAFVSDLEFFLLHEVFVFFWEFF